MFTKEKYIIFLGQTWKSDDTYVFTKRKRISAVYSICPAALRFMR